MAIIKINDETIRDNFDNETKFTIETNGIAFKVLSESLYKKPIRAIVRELLSNALDSHIAANNTTDNINITLPTVDQNCFSITDYGTSLTETEVYEIYTRFFSSTKRDNNKQTGCFGLGSKTPFAYTDTFTVTATKDGINTFYVIYLKDNTPTISKISQKRVDEPNSFTVSITVKPQDIYDFKAAVQEVLYYSNATNITLNVPKFPNYKDYLLFSYNGVSVEKVDYYKARYNFLVVKFNDINWYNVPFTDSLLQQLTLEDNTFRHNLDLIKTHHGYQNIQLIVDIPVGSVSLTPNREEIIDCEENTVFLKQVLAKAVKTAASYILYNTKELAKKYFSKGFTDYIAKILEQDNFLVESTTSIKIEEYFHRSRSLIYIINDYLEEYTDNLVEQTNTSDLQIDKIGRLLNIVSQESNYKTIPTYGISFMCKEEDYRFGIVGICDINKLPTYDFVIIDPNKKISTKIYEVIDDLKIKQNLNNKIIYLQQSYDVTYPEMRKEALSRILGVMYKAVTDNTANINVYTLDEYLLKLEPKYQNTAQLARLYRRKGVKQSNIDYNTKKILCYYCDYYATNGSKKVTKFLINFKEEGLTFYTHDKHLLYYLRQILLSIKNYLHTLEKWGIKDTTMTKNLSKFFSEKGYSIDRFMDTDITVLAVESQKSRQLIDDYAKKKSIFLTEILTVINNSIKGMAIFRDNGSLEFYYPKYLKLKKKYDAYDSNSKAVVDKLFFINTKLELAKRIINREITGTLVFDTNSVANRVSFEYTNLVATAPLIREQFVKFFESLTKYSCLNKANKISKRIILEIVQKTNKRRVGYAKTVLSNYDK